MSKRRRKKSTQGVKKANNQKALDAQNKVVSNSVSANAWITLFSALSRFVPKEFVYSAWNTMLEFLSNINN